MQRIDGVQDFLVGALDTPADQYLTVQLLLPVCGGELAELVVSVEYFDRQEQQVRQTVAQVRQEITQVTGREPAAWEVNFYPTDTNPGIIEIILRSGAKN